MGFAGSPAAIVAVQLRVYVPPAVEVPEDWMVTAGGGSVHKETIQIMRKYKTLWHNLAIDKSYSNFEGLPLQWLDK